MSDEYCLSRKEFVAMQTFQEKHIHSNIFFLEFTAGTGLGMHTDIVCGKCFEKQDVTDYDDW